MTQMPDHLVAGKVPACRIWLDGIERSFVVEACLSEGWIVETCQDASGNPVVKDDEFLTQKLHGVVRAEWVEPQE